MTPCVLPAHHTYRGIENTKAKGEVAKPYFCTQAGLIVTSVA